MELTAKLDLKTDHVVEEYPEYDTPWLKSKFQIMKNLIVLGLAWIFLFTAFQSMANLQSSLNTDQGMGTASLSAIYVSLVISCLLVPPALIKKLGLKWTIVSAQFCYTLYLAANMYPKWYILIPTAVILGFGAAPLWCAKCTYLTETAGYYSKLTNENSDAVVTRFFGIFFAMFQTSQVFGNIISSTILKPEIDMSSNFSLKNTSKLSFCGSKDCPGLGVADLIKKPQMSTVYILCGIFIGFSIISIGLISIFLKTYKRNELENSKDKTFTFSLFFSTIRLLKNKYQILIIPLTMFIGFEQAYINADFTKSFVSCTLGINHVGLTMICFGVVNVVCSYLYGYLAKYIGRIICFASGAIINYALLLTMLLWEPSAEQSLLFYIITAFWGMADAAWQTQLNSLYGILFKNSEEAAFSNFRLWESIGFAVCYAYSNYLCVNVKIYLLIVYLTIGMICYGVIEIMEKTKRKII